MTAEPKPPPRVRIVERDNRLIALERVWLWRYLVDDGTTVDIWATNDNSDVREAVLQFVKNEASKIAGVVRLEEKPDG